MPALIRVNQPSIAPAARVTAPTPAPAAGLPAAQTFIGAGGPITAPAPQPAAATAATASIGLINDFRHVRFFAPPEAATPTVLASPMADWLIG